MNYLLLVLFAMNVTAISANPRIFTLEKNAKNIPVCTEGDKIIFEEEKKSTYRVSTIVPETEKNYGVIYLRNCNWESQNHKKIFFANDELKVVQAATGQDLFNARQLQIKTRYYNFQTCKSKPIVYRGEKWYLLEKPEWHPSGSTLKLRQQNFFAETGITLATIHTLKFSAEKIWNNYTTAEFPGPEEYYRKYYWGRIAAVTTASVATTLGCAYLAYKKFWAKN
ncbi:MAG TPA: hypothetical protein VHO47_04370 [Candidatus Babeliales bacterium]|nr:hypothetical protein [Candidatus Babeliales bacterium]